MKKEISRKVEKRTAFAARKIGNALQSRVFVAKKFASKTFSALKLTASDFSTPTIFDESKKFLASCTLKGINSSFA